MNHNITPLSPVELLLPVCFFLETDDKLWTNSLLKSYINVKMFKRVT